MEILRAATLVVATITTGLMAGVFAIYANAVMPGLRRSDDRTFVRAFQSIDTAIIIPLFLPRSWGRWECWGGCPRAPPGRQAVRASLVLAAFAPYLFAVVSTIAVNVPLNDALKAASDPDRIPDLAALRERFDEPKWSRWNVARAVTTTAAFACLCWALAERGQAI
jgi:uncharacterized membrane protein